MLTADVAVDSGTSIVGAADISDFPDGDSDMFDTMSELIGVCLAYFFFPSPVFPGDVDFLSVRG